MAAASSLVAQAKAVEPSLTPLLVDLARQEHGEMMKLEYRLKTVESTTRKLRTALAGDPALKLVDVRIDDALRYTMKVDDVPPGHYLSAAKDTLVALETRGHHVEYVKNYWPANDNYSGINSVLRDPSGLFWELQFHTGASFEAQLETRAEYEEIRALDTPLERQRELFDRMTERWNRVPIPEGVLTEGAIHLHEQLRERARP